MADISMTSNIVNISNPVRYRIIEDLANLSGDYLVLNDTGVHEFKINGTALFDEDLIRLEDIGGTLLCQSSAHMARKQNILTISNRTGEVIGSVQRHPVSPLRDRFSLEIGNAPELSTEGDVSSLEFWIVNADGTVAEISRRWFRARNSFGVAIGPGQPVAVLLTGVIIIVQMIRGTL